MCQHKNTYPPFRYSDDALNEFKTLFQQKLKAAEAELIRLHQFIEEKNKQDPEEKYREMEIDQLSFFIKRHQELIDHLKESLKRIDEKTFGVCRNTGKLIEKEKLLTSPHGKKNEE
jgi:DnaK suppressor protein